MRIGDIGNVVINGNRQPEDSVLAGYSALKSALSTKAPFPKQPSVVSRKGIRSDAGKNHAVKNGFSVFKNTYHPGDGVGDHLVFALKNERLDLLALKAVFDKVNEEYLCSFISEAPTSAVRRQIWFFYEFLTDSRLNLPDLGVASYVDLIDPTFWEVGPSENSSRHRVRNNLPGNSRFCALVERLDTAEQIDLATAERRLQVNLGGLGKDMMSRLTKRLLIKDSKSSFQIEGENPSGSQQFKWAEINANAGRETLDLDLLVRLQKTALEHTRFVKIGLRSDNVFLGERVDEVAVPSWIGAKPEDVPSLVAGLFDASAKLKDSEMSPIAKAAAISFGWVFIHPFEDGNGRIHRYLMQHILAENGLRPNGISIPISKAIWSNMDGYSRVLRSFDEARFPLMDWRPTNNGNVEVLNDTIDLYRFADFTEQARFLMGCYDHALDRSIPDEIEAINRRDRVLGEISRIVDMPARTAETLVAVILNNKGKLSKSKRKKQFGALTDVEVGEIEDIVQDVYEIDDSLDDPSPSM